MKQDLLTYLLMYSDIQKDITLVYRPTLKDHWGNRCKFLGKKYNPKTKYNHRSILANELVIEYDEDDKSINSRCAERVTKRLRNDDLPYMKADSGNKSTHIHFFVDLKEAKYPEILKKTIMRHYGTFWVEDNKVYNEIHVTRKRKRIIPDLRLAGGVHLVRAEFGVHEKTSNHKTVMTKFRNYGKCLSQLPEEIWIKYQHNVRKYLEDRLKYNTKDLENSPFIKYLLGTDFKEAEDGRDRAMFILIHVLKPKYKDNKEDLIKYMQDWYRYAGGYKLTPWAIQCKVEYHFKKHYDISERYIKEFLFELGIEM